MIDGRSLVSKPPGFPAKTERRIRRTFCAGILGCGPPAACPTKRAGLWLLSHQHGLMSHQLGIMSHQPGFLNPKARLIKPSNDAGNQSNEANVPSNGGGLCDPDSQHPLLEPKADFYRSFAKKKETKKKNFQWKLSYDQINNDILDNYSILSVHCLLSPTFRKYTQDRDKELAPVLNIKPPFVGFMVLYYLTRMSIKRTSKLFSNIRFVR